MSAPVEAPPVAAAAAAGAVDVEAAGTPQVIDDDVSEVAGAAEGMAADPATAAGSVAAELLDTTRGSHPTAAIDDAMCRVLTIAREHCARRGSRVLREADVAFAVEAERTRMGMPASVKPTGPRWYSIPVEGDGGCLFTSMRLLLELHYVVRHIEAGSPPERLLIDGMSPRMVNAGRTLRATVVEWYRRFLQREVPQLGEYNAGGRLWQRGDLLALEMVRRGTDMPEAGPTRLASMLEYLTAMAQPGVWGGTPEYTAVACMTHKTVRVWQFQPPSAGGGRELHNVNTIVGAPPLVPAAAGAEAAPGAGAGAGVAAGAGDAGAAVVNAPAQGGADGSAMSLDGAPVSVPASPASAQLDAEVYDEMDEEGTAEEDSDSESEDADAQPLCIDLFFENNHYVAMVSARTRRMLARAYGEAVVAHLRPLA